VWKNAAPTDLVELEQNVARQLDVFLADVLEGDQHAAEVADVAEDLLLGGAEAGHRLELAGAGDALRAHHARQRRLVLVVVVRRIRADRLATTLQAPACLQISRRRRRTSRRTVRVIYGRPME